MFSGRKSARSDAGARFAASVSNTTGVEVFSGKIGKPRVSNLGPCCRFFQRKHQSKAEDRPEKHDKSQRRTGKGNAKCRRQTVRCRRQPLEIAVCNSRKVVVAVPDASDRTSDDRLRHSTAKRDGRGGRS